MVLPRDAQPLSLALFLPNWVGDTVMATPAIRAIRRHYPRPHRLIGIIRPKMQELLAGTEWFDDLWPWEPKWRGGSPNQWHLIVQMRRRPIDILVLFTNSLRTALLALLGGARQRVGFARDGRSWLLTTKLFPEKAGGKVVPRPMVTTYLSLAEAVGCPPESPHLELHLTPEERHLARLIFTKLKLQLTKRTVALVYAGAQGPARRWPAEYYVQLARYILAETHWQILVVAGPDDRQVAELIRDRINHARAQTMTELPHLGLSAAKACLAASDVVVTPDSGPRYIAAAFNKPLITLFGPTDPIWGSNPTINSADLFVDLPCRGCLQPVCPLNHHRCMKELTPQLVFDTFCKVIENYEASQSAFTPTRLFAEQA